MSILDKILVKSQTSKSKKHAVSKGRRLGFEGLENRELLSVSPYAPAAQQEFLNDYDISAPAAAVNHPAVSLQNGVLTISGTSRDDWVEVQETSTGIIVQSSFNGGSTYTAIGNYTKSQVTRIDFFGYAGDDTFKNAYNGVSCSIACRLYGGAGNDYLLGGSGNDLLDGGDGDNMLIGGRGANTFYNTGTGSNCFVWMGSGDQWASGSSNTSKGGDDAQLRFSNKDRLGNTSYTYNGTTYSFASWNEEQVLLVADIIYSAYDKIGSYKYFQHQRNSDNSIYFCYTNHPSPGFRGLCAYNSGIHFSPFTDVFTSEWVVIHEVAHLWNFSNSGSGSANPYWNEFSSISWADKYATLKQDAKSTDFVSGYAMTNSNEDWADTVAYIICGEMNFDVNDPSSFSQKAHQKINIVHQFLDWLNPKRETASTVVTTNLDIVDVNDGLISLREAIMYAGTRGLGTTVTFASSMQGKTVTLNGSQIEIYKDITIDASARNVSIDAKGESRVFYIGSGATVALTGLTITNGQADGSFGGGGGIYNSATLTITDCTILKNAAAWGGGIYSYGSSAALTITNSAISGNNASSNGGGIYSGGTATVTNCTITGNVSNSSGGGIYAPGSITVINSTVAGNTAGTSGGGIYNSATLTITDSTILENAATSGGGIYSYGSSAALTITNSAISGNNASSNGGGIFSGGTATVTNCTITGNVSNSSGGGVYNSATLTITDSTILENAATSGGGINNRDTLSVVNCTISGNSAVRNASGTGGGGGGINSGGTATVVNSVISGNSAARYGGGIYASGSITVINSTVAGNTAGTRGGGIYANDTNSQLTINNSIVATNSSPSFPDIDRPSQTITGSNNLIGDGTGQNSLVNGTNGNIIGTASSPVDPLFVRFTPYTTWSKELWKSWDLHLQQASQAVNAGSNSLIPSGVTKDLSGNARIVGGRVDMGAYEFVVVPASPATASAVSASGNVTKISWSQVDGATSYDIMGYNKAGNYWWKIGTTNGTSYTAPAYTANVTAIAVHAVNPDGRSTGKAASIFRAPTTVSAVAASGNQTKISWNAVAGATSYEIMGYNKAGNYWWKIGATNSTSYNAPAYTANVTTIAVHAIRGSDRTSGAATSIFRAPAGVSVVAASATQTKITWNAVSGATSYDIMGYNKAGNYWWKIGNVKGTSYNAPGYSANVTTIAVHAIRGSDRTSGTTAPVVRAPSNVTASSLSSTSIRFSWNAVAGATRYELSIYNSVTKKWSTLTSVTQNTYTATGLPVGVTQVSVHALNAAGRTAGATATVR